MNNLVIVVGHYGSGKTEFCVNFALGAAEKNTTVLIDMDIVNPYFRSREQSSLLTSRGIHVVGGSTGLDNLSADMPALPAEIEGYADNLFDTVIMDVGGDANGSRVLSRYASRISSRPYDMLLVVNANRPLTRTPEGVIKYLEGINAQSRLQVTGLVNNTHMLRETTSEDILRGAQLSAEVASMTGLPVVYNVAPASLRNDPGLNAIERLFFVELYMRPKWL